MSKRILQIVQEGYRCNNEEQDDPVVWITHVMRGAGGELDLLLQGSAVNYGVKTQDASGLRFGSMDQDEPPNLPRDLGSLMQKGAHVYVVEDDCSERGLETTEFIPGLTRIRRSELAALFEGYDLVWTW